MGTVLHGTSSWSEKSWVGVFYPPGTKPGDFLAHYAREFPAVEVDATYYAQPAKAMVEGWKRKTPDGFVLAAKVPRDIVHGGEGATPDPAKVLEPDAVGDAMRRFCGLMRLLGDRCGPLVLQLPYLNKTVFPDAGAFGSRLDRFLGTLPDDLRFAVEVRNRAWLGRDLTGILRKHRAALVLSELPYLPHPADLAASLDVVTTDFVYARLIGDRKAIDAKTESFDKVVLDRSASLARWGALLRVLRDRVPRTFVFANNHYAGHAPATIRELMRRIAEGEGPGSRVQGPGSEPEPAPEPKRQPAGKGKKPSTGQGELF